MEPLPLSCAAAVWTHDSPDRTNAIKPTKRFGIRANGTAFKPSPTTTGRRPGMGKPATGGSNGRFTIVVLDPRVMVLSNHRAACAPSNVQLHREYPRAIPGLAACGDPTES